MSEALEQFWESQLPVPGLIAWGARLTNGTVQSGCRTDSFAPAQMEQLMKGLLEAAQSLEQNGIHPSRLCWVFEHARMYLAKRKDASYLGLLMENKPELSIGVVERVLMAFEELGLGS